jgi:ribosomal protein S18 acetylase RimI-like enzyme
MAKIQITPLELRELQTLRELCIQTFRQAYEPVKIPVQFQAYMDKAFSEDQLRSELVRPQSHYYFISLDEKPVGYLMLNVEEAQSESKGAEYMEIQRIYLLKEFKGLGLGAQLIRFSMQQAKKLGKSKVWLGVWEENAEAIRFYEKMGFAVTGSHVFMVGNVPEKDWVMEKWVD